MYKVKNLTLEKKYKFEEKDNFHFYISSNASTNT